MCGLLPLKKMTLGKKYVSNSKVLVKEKQYFYFLLQVS